MGGGPIKPVNFLNVGGVNLNGNQVKSHETIKKNGQTLHRVQFNSGVFAEYPTQNAKQNASLYSHAWDDIDGRATYTESNNLDNASISGTDKSDNIILNGNNGTKVDISGDENSDFVSVNDSVKGEKYGAQSSKWSEPESDSTRYLERENIYTHAQDKASENNTIMTDEKDSIDFDTKNTVAEVEGQGTTSELALKGVYQEPDKPSDVEPAPSPESNPDFSSASIQPEVKPKSSDKPEGES